MEGYTVERPSLFAMWQIPKWSSVATLAKFVALQHHQMGYFQCYGHLGQCTLNNLIILLAR